MEKFFRYLKHPSVIMPTIMFSIVGWVYYSYSYYPETTLNETITQAKKGDVKAQLRAANLLLVCLNDYRRATGLVEEEDLSSLNSFGLYTLCNVRAGKNWSRKAAEAGSAEGQYRMGLLWHPDDDGESADWFKQAAAQGHAKAQVVLGSINAPTDKAESYYWFTLALKAPDAEWKANIEAERAKVAKDMTKEQIAEAEKRAAEFKPVSVLPPEEAEEKIKAAENAAEEEEKEEGKKAE